ncbi:bidirectional sugar transporter SWEET4-like [Gastrolobium bilobum]|uniref:bidirectional sugar transporter SWEET4-like n=1 Tax=Gastrolobium bilobum TaxID=150636 RepID=UPI002AB31001|nr:bidirectional sugar transporter SWEET4-like [Gastrolobium bilobum]
MSAADIARTVVGIIGNIISAFMFLSPLPTFIGICKKGSVEQYSAAPYLATLVNCMVWTLYGLPIVHPHSLLVVTINGSGCVIEIIYVTLFLIYSHRSKRLKILLWLVVELIFIAALTVITLTMAHTVKERSSIVGTTCILFNIMMYASPLAVMTASVHHNWTFSRWFFNSEQTQKEPRSPDDVPPEISDRTATARAHTRRPFNRE